MRNIRTKVAFVALPLFAAGIAFLAGSSIEEANARPLPQDQLLGIEWPNLIVGVDHSAVEVKDGVATSAPRWFAEIHLMIPLSNAGVQAQIANFVSAKNDTGLRKLLKDQLSGVANNDANKRLIDAYEIRQ